MCIRDRIKKAAEEKPEALELMACYEAYACIAAKNQLLEQLEDHGMKKLYDEIEMPLVYCLLYTSSFLLMVGFFLMFIQEK